MTTTRVLYTMCGIILLMKLVEFYKKPPPCDKPNIKLVCYDGKTTWNL